MAKSFQGFRKNCLKMTNNYCSVFLFLLPFLQLLSSESVEEEQGDPYYGVPLGALHYSAEGTSAEVYAADEFSIIFNHFYHNPREHGCTGMMIGPPRTEDKENVVPGHGVLLAMAHPPAAAKHKQKRAKRTVEGRQSQFRGYWPAEFDHLLMGPEEERPKSKEEKRKGSGGGKQGSGKTEQRKEEQQKTVLNRVNLSNTSVTEQLIRGNGWALDSNSFPTSANSTTTATNTSSHSSPNPSSSSPSLPPPSSSPPSPISSSSSSSSSPSSSSHLNSSIPSTTPIRTVPTTTHSTARPNPPILLLSNKKAKESPQQLQSPEIVREVVEMVKAGGAEVRRSPARHNFDDAAMDDWVKANELDDNGKDKAVPPTLRTSASSRTTTTPAATTTPLFWVIKDPREARRERLLQLRRKFDPNPEPLTTTTTAAPFSPLESQFELPKIRDKLATFSLTNGAKITQYKWIGLWNQCTKRTTHLVSLRDVDPPREEKIMPLSGWSHNVTSYRLHILNCNTILIPSFHYDSRNTTRNTFFFVGVGQFPEAVEQQVKAKVVGSRTGEPLRSYLGEDVLLRLPRPYRTFDIDFISIFNVDEQKSFGHVIIPSLLVPPCPDDE